MPMTNAVPAAPASRANYTSYTPRSSADGLRRGARQSVDTSHGMAARRQELVQAGANEPLARVASLLIAISRNNGYEGRDPNSIPEALTSGFVADLLGVDIASLAAHLMELRGRGLVDQQPSTGLRLKNIAALEALADAG